jgi:hypothetical protein
LRNFSPVATISAAFAWLVHHRRDARLRVRQALAALLAGLQALGDLLLAAFRWRASAAAR